MNKKFMMVPVGSRETGLGALENCLGNVLRCTWTETPVQKESPGTWPCTMYVGKSEF